MEENSHKLLFSGKQKLKRSETSQSSYENQDIDSTLQDTNGRSSLVCPNHHTPSNHKNILITPATQLLHFSVDRNMDQNAVLGYACRSNNIRNPFTIDTADIRSISMDNNNVYISPMEPKVCIGPPDNWEKILNTLQVNPCNSKINPRRSSIAASLTNRNGGNTDRKTTSTEECQNQICEVSTSKSNAQKDTCRTLEPEVEPELPTPLLSHELQYTINSRVEESSQMDSGESSSKAQTRVSSPILSDTELDGKKHVCQLCNRSFSRPSALKTHMYTHTGEKPFTCTYRGCEKRFSVESNLRRHYRLHLSHERHAQERFARDTYEQTGISLPRKPPGFHRPPSK